MMAINDVSKNRKNWRSDFATAQERLGGLGGQLYWSDTAYEVARWVHPKLVLIFYPHKTTAGNYHILIRKGKCDDREILRKAILALAENTCRFGFPSEPELHGEGVQHAFDVGRS